MKSKFKWTLAIVSIGLLCIGVPYITQNFLFNPLTFKRDDVTHLPWYWYKKPMTIRVTIIDTNPRPYQYTKIQFNNSEEVKYMFDELKKGQTAIADTNYAKKGREIIIQCIRYDGNVVLGMNGKEGTETTVLTHEPNKPIKMTNQLLEFINTKAKEQGR